MRGMSGFLPIPVGYLVLVIQRRSRKHRPAADQPELPAMAGAGGAAPSGDATP